MKTISSVSCILNRGLALAALTACVVHASDPTPAPSAAGVDRTVPPKAGPFPKVNFPDADVETLPNGLRVYLLPDRREPTVTYRLLIKSGEMFDGAKPGLASLTAAMLNKGTEALTADQFARKTDFLGASVEANSGDDAISVVASGLSTYTAELLTFLSDAALRPAFREEELVRQKRQETADLAQKKMDPETLAARLRDKLLYGKHPYGAFATPESVQSITRDDVAGFHKKYFIPNNATLIVVGDIDRTRVLEAVRKAFGDWKQGAVPAVEAPAFPKIEGVSVHLVDRPGSVQSAIEVATRGVPRNNPETAELAVVNSILGGGFSGRLFANLREKHAYTYGAYSSFQEKKYGGTFAATAQVRNAVTADAAAEILNELKRIRSEPVPEQEVRLQRNYLAGNFLIGLESQERTAGRFQDIDLYGLPADYYKHFAERLTAVTPDVASALARRYINPVDAVIIVVGEAKEVLPQLKRLGPVTVYDTDLKPVGK